MLSKEEEDFIIYWKTNRERQKKTFRQFLLGIPLALLFVVPIGLNFFSGWYKRATMVSRTSEFSPGILLLALILIVVFIAIFSRKFKWEQYEQRYIELLNKKQKQEENEKKGSDAAF
jgi:ABC-type dipeptide/oligopeptide/nickel transport system permease component